MSPETFLEKNPRANIVELLTERAARHPERTALSYLGDGESVTERLSYAALHARARAVAAELSGLGAPGERALVLCATGSTYAVSLLGCLYAGWIAVPAYAPESLEPRHTERVLGIAKDAKPRVVLTERGLEPVLRRAQSQLPWLAAVKLCAADAIDLSHADAWRAPDFAQQPVAFLQYTSGSTAEPKGVVVRHDNLVANERVIRRAFSLGEDDVVVSWLPLFHDMGLVGALLQPLFSGASLVLMTPQHFIERPLRWLMAISTHGGTVSGAPDFAYRLCAARARSGLPEGLTLSSWQLAFCGAEPVRAATLDGFAARFEGAGFRRSALYPCYGLAEATLLATGGRRGEGVSVRRFDARALADGRVVDKGDGAVHVACGRVQPDHALAIVDPQSGAPAAPGTVGEIQLAGPSVTRGYWQKPELNAGCFVEREGQSFLRTGDLGFVHDGQLFVAGRQKDLIIVRGHNLYPQDLERSVEDAVEVVRKGRVAAFGVELDGQERVGVAAEVSARARAWIEPVAVCRAIAEATALAYGEPAELVLLVAPGALPLTSSGKLQRAACKKAWLADRLEVVALWRGGELVEPSSRAQGEVGTQGRTI